MYVVVPLAGRGSRFSSCGYNIPKPLIDINGKPMIVRMIETLGLDGKYVFVVRTDAHSEALKQVIIEVLPSAKIVEIDFFTEGPASSAYLAKDHVSPDEELVIANCDQLMSWDSEMFLLNARQYDGAVVTYFSETTKNSYASVNRFGLVKLIKEKEVISNISLNGVHYWSKAHLFFDSVVEMVDAQARAPNGEFYVGPSYNFLITKGYRIGIYHIPNEYHHPVGVPEDLVRFVENENTSDR